MRHRMPGRMTRRNAGAFAEERRTVMAKRALLVVAKAAGIKSRMRPYKWA
jgi:hypothetical protein